MFTFCVIYGLTIFRILKIKIKFSIKVLLVSKVKFVSVGVYISYCLSLCRPVSEFVSVYVWVCVSLVMSLCLPMSEFVSVYVFICVGLCLSLCLSMHKSACNEQPDCIIANIFIKFFLLPNGYRLLHAAANRKDLLSKETDKQAWLGFEKNPLLKDSGDGMCKPMWEMGSVMRSSHIEFSIVLFQTFSSSESIPLPTTTSSISLSEPLPKQMYYSLLSFRLMTILQGSSGARLSSQE